MSDDDLDGVDWAVRLLGPSIADQIDKYYEELEREGGYTKDWGFISRQYRESKDFECEACGVSLAEHKRLLHVHHRDGNKVNNDPLNLISLCILCHAEEHYHLNAEISHEDRQLILALRRMPVRNANNPLLTNKK